MGGQANVGRPYLPYVWGRWAKGPKWHVDVIEIVGAAFDPEAGAYIG